MSYTHSVSTHLPLVARADGAPATVVASFWLWRIGCLLVIAGGLGVLIAGLLAQYLIADDDYEKTITTTVSLFAIGLLLLAFAVAGMLVTQKLESGRRWARAVLTLSGTVIVGLMAPRIPLLPAVSIGMVTAIAIILMYLPSSNVYFRHASS